MKKLLTAFLLLPLLSFAQDYTNWPAHVAPIATPFSAYVTLTATDAPSFLALIGGSTNSGGGSASNVIMGGVLSGNATNAAFSTSGTNAINLQVTNLAIAKQNGFGTNTTLRTGMSVDSTNINVLGFGAASGVITFPNGDTISSAANSAFLSTEDGLSLGKGDGGILFEKYSYILGASNDVKATSLNYMTNGLILGFGNNIGDGGVARARNKNTVIGNGNTSLGQSNILIGNGITVSGDGSAVISSTPVSTSANNTMVINYASGVAINTNSAGGNALEVTGNIDSTSASATTGTYSIANLGTVTAGAVSSSGISSSGNMDAQSYTLAGQPINFSTFSNSVPTVIYCTNSAGWTGIGASTNYFGQYVFNTARGVWTNTHNASTIVPAGIYTNIPSQTAYGFPSASTTFSNYYYVMVTNFTRNFVADISSNANWVASPPTIGDIWFKGNGIYGNWNINLYVYGMGAISYNASNYPVVSVSSFSTPSIYGNDSGGAGVINGLNIGTNLSPAQLAAAGVVTNGLTVKAGVLGSTNPFYAFNMYEHPEAEGLYAWSSAYNGYTNSSRTNIQFWLDSSVTINWIFGSNRVDPEGNLNFYYYNGSVNAQGFPVSPLGGWYDNWLDGTTAFGVDMANVVTTTNQSFSIQKGVPTTIVPNPKGNFVGDQNSIVILAGALKTNGTLIPLATVGSEGGEGLWQGRLMCFTYGTNANTAMVNNGRFIGVMGEWGDDNRALILKGMGNQLNQNGGGAFILETAAAAGSPGTHGSFNNSLYVATNGLMAIGNLTDVADNNANTLKPPFWLTIYGDGSAWSGGSSTVPSFGIMSKALVSVPVAAAEENDGTYRYWTDGTASRHKYMVEGVNANASGLTNLPATQLTGTVPDASLGSAALTNRANTFTANQTFALQTGATTNIVQILSTNGTRVFYVDSNGIVNVRTNPASSNFSFISNGKLVVTNESSQQSFIFDPATSTIGCVAASGSMGITLGISGSGYVSAGGNGFFGNLFLPNNGTISLQNSIGTWGGYLNVAGSLFARTNIAPFSTPATTIIAGTKWTNTFNARAAIDLFVVGTDAVGGLVAYNLQRGTITGASTTNVNVNMNLFGGVTAAAFSQTNLMPIQCVGTNEWILLTDQSSGGASFTILTNQLHLQ